MPPKKKQQEIDVSTLPECVSLNCMLFCKGRKQRSDNILTKIFSTYKSLIAQVSKQQVLDHAKQKNIYVDPNTLNDKQKKDPKFMQTICTQLTAEVIAKASVSYIDSQNLKVRLSLKSSSQKPQNQQQKSLFQKKLDQIYVFNEFPQQRSEFQALSQSKQDIRFILIINPIINWSNAPQINSQQNDQQEEDQQIKQFKLLKAKETYKQPDTQYEQTITNKVQQIRHFRRQAPRDSRFRDTIIQTLDVEIDPYNEGNSINEALKAFISSIAKLNLEYDDYLEWKKQRTAQPIIQQIQSMQNKQSLSHQILPESKQLTQAKGQSATQILQNFVDSLFSGHQRVDDQSNGLQDLINGYDFSKAGNRQQVQRKLDVQQQNKKNQPFYSQNQTIFSNLLLQPQLQVLQSLQFPGINRYQMPETASISSPLRKSKRSQYVQFLSQSLPYTQFQRQLSLLKFQQIIKQVDEDRIYNFGTRVYQEHHDGESLKRELYRAINMTDAHVVTKYNQDNDKLYLALLYRNDHRRAHLKTWDSNWKVIPNYQFWLKYFKENQNNLNNLNFYDIDYQKIGHINSQVCGFSIPDGGIIIKKNSKIANSESNTLYCIKNEHKFGLNKDTFYSHNKQNSLYHTKVSEDFETIIHLSDKMTIRLKSSGQVLVTLKNGETRMYTAKGYTVLYHDPQLNKFTILHPTGGISNQTSYVNERGFGIKNGVIFNVPALLRRTDQYQLIKRDDQTVIIKDQTTKWIRFEQGTQYLIKDYQISIEMKNFPFITCKNGVIQVQIDDIVIKGQKQNDKESFIYNITYSNGNKLQIRSSVIQVTQKSSALPYVINLDKESIEVEFQNEKLQISEQANTYILNNKKYITPCSQQQISQGQKLPLDYIEPRLFVISSDNTGVQYLSQKQLQFYLNPNENNLQQMEINGNIHTIKNLQGINKSIKKINHGFKVDLDVFRISQNSQVQNNTSKFFIRSFIRNPEIAQQDKKNVIDIIDKHEDYVKIRRKQQNQFGHKSKNDPIIQKLKNQKNTMIDFRKKILSQVQFNFLKKQAINSWKSKQQKQASLIQQQRQQQKILQKMKKRKNSYVQQYLPLVLNEKEHQDDTQNYSPAGFYTHYFETAQGKKALSAMPDWVFRPKTAKKQSQLDPQIVTELNNTMNRTKKNQSQAEQVQKQRYDTVEVNLNPIRQIYIKPSVFTQRQIDQQRQAFEEQKKAYFYHEKKRKDFNLYGRQREQKIDVKSLHRTQPISQINQKYLITQAPFDKKIKISSMKNKLTSQASSIFQMRKQGPHNTLLKTLDMRNDYNTLLQKRTMMVHADLNDKLQRDILITPADVSFGYLKEGKSYQFKINVKNQDILAQRLILKKPRNLCAKVQISQMGPIALGISRKIIVQLKAESIYLGKYSDEFEIVSKHEIYRIPITAIILSESQFENDQVKLSQGVRQIQQIKRKTSALPPIN